ncbi:MAG: signal peptidase I [Victivallales bacterium]|nr:signal peptidase I [Victivallales bacterium]
MRRCFWCFDFSRRGLIRLGLVAAAATLWSTLVCRPMVINGGSMVPTYSVHGFNFCWKPTFWFGQPRRGQVVIARYLGEEVMLLKRVVALAGDTVEFRHGRLLVNGAAVTEPYVKSGCNWNLPRRRIADGCVYLVGDNRGMPMEQHKFGEISRRRITGVPLW